MGKAVNVKAEKGQWVDLGIPTSCISSPAKCDYNGSTIAFWVKNPTAAEGGILSSHEDNKYSFVLQHAGVDIGYVSFHYWLVRVSLVVEFGDA